jgi:hypothetical protein
MAMGTTTLGITTFSTTILSVSGLHVTLSINDIKHKFEISTTMLCHYAECHYAECRVLFIVMLIAVKLSVFMLNVVMLSVVAPGQGVHRPGFTLTKLLTAISPSLFG